MGQHTCLGVRGVYLGLLDISIRQEVHPYEPLDVMTRRTHVCTVRCLLDVNKSVKLSDRFTALVYRQRKAV